MSKLGEKIKRLRSDCGMKQSELAKLIGVGTTTISNYETGYSAPDIETLAAIAAALNVSMEYLASANLTYEDSNLGLDLIRPRRGQKIASIKVLGTIPAGTPIEAIEDFIGTEEIVINNNVEVGGSNPPVSSSKRLVIAFFY